MLPAPDLATIFLSNAIIAGVAAVVLSVIRRYQPGLQGIGAWAVGQGAYAIGFFLLYVSLSEGLQPSALPGFLCAFAGALLTSLGFHHFLDRPRRAARAAIIVFMAIGTLLVVLSSFSLAGHIMAIAVAVLGSLAGLNAWLLYFSGRGYLRPAALTLAAQYGFWSLYAMARLIYIVATGFDKQSAVSTLAPAMLVATIMLTCHALGLVWLVVGRLQEHLVHQAATDPLTGALNRRALQGRLDQEQARALRDGGGFALVTFDLDHFKQLNDTHGHVVGDATLLGVVETARTLLRPGDEVARLGGEEFCLLLPNVTGREAADIAEQLRVALTALVIPSPAGPVAVAASFGVAWYGAHGQDWASLLKAADGALYCAKRNGRNRVEAATAGA